MSYIQAIEKTGKVWKFLMIASTTALVAAGIMIAIDMENHTHSLAVPSGLCLILGWPTWLFARLSAWWRHG